MTSAQVLAHETAKYRAVWAMPAYRVKCHSLNLWRQYRDLFPASIGSALDIGCGLGRLVPVLLEEGIDAYGVDLVPDVSVEEAIRQQYQDRFYAASLWAFDPGRVFDVGINCDVMEHIPEEHVSETLTRMAVYCRAAVFKIANFPSNGLGHQLHLTQRGAVWWHATLQRAMGGTVTHVPHDWRRTSTGPTYLFTWTASCGS